METSQQPVVSKGLTIFLAVIISAVISGGGVFLLTRGKSIILEPSPVDDTSSKTEPTEVNNSPKEESQNNAPEDLTLTFVPEGRQTFYGTDGFAYQLVTFYPKSSNGLTEGADQRILRYDQKTEKTEVLVKSVNEKYPEFKGWIIGHVSAIDNQVIFQSLLPESDAPPGPYYSLNLKTLDLTKLKVNDIFLSKEGAIQNGVLSPSTTGLKALWLPTGADSKAQTAYLFDLQNDTYKEILTLKNNETFSGGEGVMIGFNSDIEWIADNKIRYAVFDDKLNDNTTFEDFYKALIEYRELVVE